MSAASGDKSISLRNSMYAPILGVAAVILLAKSVAYASILPVEQFGELNQLLLVVSYAVAFGGLGMHSLAQKRLPLLHLEGDEQAVVQQLGVTIACFLIIGVPMSAIGVLVLADRHGMDGYVIPAVVLLSVAQYLFTLFLVDVRSEMKFVRHATLSLIRAAAVLLGGLVAAVLTQDPTVVLLVEALTTGLIAYLALTRVRRMALSALMAQPSRLSAVFGTLLPQALRLLWLNGLMVIVFSLDRVFGVALLSAHEYGLYSLGLTTLLVFENLQSIVSVAAWPILARRVGVGDRIGAFAAARSWAGFTIVICMLVYVPVAYWTEDILHAVLPKYAESADVVRVLALAGILRLSDFFSMVSILCDQEQVLIRRLTLVAAVFASGYVVLDRVGLLEGTPMEVASLAVTVATVVFLTNAFTAWRGIRPRPCEQLA